MVDKVEKTIGVFSLFTRQNEGIAEKSLAHTPTKQAYYRAAEYRRRGGFDTAQELWKESDSLPTYSTTGLTLSGLARIIHEPLAHP